MKVGDLTGAFQRRGGLPITGQRDLPVCNPFACEVLRKVLLDSLRQVYECGRWYVFGRCGERILVTPRKTGVPRQSEQPVADRGAAHQLLKVMGISAVVGIAPCCHAQRFTAGNVVAAKIVHRRSGGEVQPGRSACQGEIEKDFSPPALIVAADQFCHLAQLRAAPLEVDLKWHVSQGIRPLPRAGELQQPGIVQVHVSAKRLRFEADAPGILRFLPQGEIRIGQCVRLLLRALLEVYASRGALDVREGRPRPHFRTPRGRERDSRRAF